MPDKRHFHFLHMFMALAILCSTLGPSLARSEESHANGTVELAPMTVTAEKREGDASAIPTSITLLNETQIQDFDLKSASDLEALTPNLYITRGGASTSNRAAMRGITSSMTGDPVMGFYLDGVYYGSGLDIGLFDVERVEVLRGPQGTLYGRNSEAGVVNVVTKKPGDEWEGSLSADVGTFNSYTGTAMLGGPLIDGRLGIRGNFRYHTTDGWFENQYDGSNEAGQEDNFDGRLSVIATPSDQLELRLIYDGQHYDSASYAPFAPMNDSDMRHSVNVDDDGKADKDADGLSLTADYAWESMALTSITSVRSEDQTFANDIDFTPIDLMAMSIGSETRGVSQELRLHSTDDSPLQWIGGAFLLHEERDGQADTWMNFMNMGMGMPGETLGLKNTTTTNGFALFGEASYLFFERLKLTLGLRYDLEQKDFNYSQTPGGPVLGMMGYADQSGSQDDTFEAWLPKAALSYALTEGIMPYASVSRGFKSGGFNTIDNLGRPYEPEFTWNYEIGVKTNWFDNRLQANLALFHIDWTDVQVEVPTAGGTSTYIENAGEATSQGVELEVLARPLQGLELLMGGAYTDARYEEYTSGENVYDDNRFIDSPEYTLNLGLTYRLPGTGLFTNMHYARFGAIAFDPANTREQDDYGVLSAKVGYEGDGYEVYLYGRNLLDEEYVTRAFAVNDAWYGRAGEPQIFGVNVKFYF